MSAMRWADCAPLARTTRSPRSCVWMAKLATCAIVSPASSTVEQRSRQQAHQGPLSHRGQHVALPAHRLDDRRLPRVLTQALAQPADLDIQCPVEGAGITGQHQLDQLVAGEHGSRMVQQGSQQLEFRGAERDHDAVALQPLMVHVPCDAERRPAAFPVPPC